MPPAKIRTTQLDDSRSDVSNNNRDRQITNNTYTKKVKSAAGTTHNGATRDSGSALKELALVSTENGDVIAPGQSVGMNWSTVPLDMLDNYRVAYNISSPAAFSSPLNQALLTRSAIGKQSPTMARKRAQRRVPREQLAMAVRKHFNGAAVGEIDVVVEMAYKVKHQHKAFRMRSIANGVKR